MTDDNAFHLFNTKTMSGVHPGSRTAHAHVFRWESQQDDQRTLGWARILWPGESGDAAIYWLENGQGWADQPALQIAGENGRRPIAGLLTALTAMGRQPRVCGSCRWWQPVADVANPEGIPLGLCSWPRHSAHTGSRENRQQSALAMECPHWQTGEQVEAQPDTPAETQSPVQRDGWWSGLKERLTGKAKKSGPAASTGGIDERSGVGAGTERCLACHGRIANLGGLTVAAEGDDKRTLSVWRCRLCHTFYLNDWIDRWERLNSLETEESYYRLAPNEAFDLLALFRESIGGEDPRQRHSREAQRTRVDAFLLNRPPLMHQIKQGR